jgi:hypothetical protein
MYPQSPVLAPVRCLRRASGTDQVVGIPDGLERRGARVDQVEAKSPGELPGAGPVDHVIGLGVRQRGRGIAALALDIDPGADLVDRDPALLLASLEPVPALGQSGTRSGAGRADSARRAAALCGVGCFVLTASPERESDSKGDRDEAKSNRED